MSGVLRYSGVTHFRQRIQFATLSGRTVRIDGIRGKDDNPGVQGTTVVYRPGVVVGAKSLDFDCGATKSIGILPLLLFAKIPSFITFDGVTNDDQDITVDGLRTATNVLLKKFGVEGGIDLKIVKRGCAPLGGGRVTLRVPIVKTLTPINLVDPGRFLRIRGVAFASKVSPQMANRMVDGARGDLRRVIDDIFIATDHTRASDGSSSPGYGISLVAETTAGVVVCSERVVTTTGVLPEDIAVAAAHMLCEEMESGGCVDSTHQSLALVLMALCPEDVSRIRLGRLTPFTIQTLRQLQDFFGVTFKITTEASSRTLLLSCLGIGYKNLARPAQ